MAVEPRYGVRGTGYAYGEVSRQPLAPETSAFTPPPGQRELEGVDHSEHQSPTSTTPGPSCLGGGFSDERPSLTGPLEPEAGPYPVPRTPYPAAPEAPHPASLPAGGHHLLVDLWVSDPEPLRHVATWEALLPEACRASGATVIGHRFHQFQPEGVTGIVLLAESHASVHTWPEAGLATLDVFTCGALDAHAIVDRIRAALSPVRERVTAVARGDRAALPPETPLSPEASGVPFPPDEPAR